MNEQPIQQQSPPDRMLKFFSASHLPAGPIRDTSEEFGYLARRIETQIAPGPERTVALRKLLEAKDAAVRAVIYPKG